ncbi:hypothetical protein MPSEU_000107600 [Mayamaea pseudoterrestris]|nr:hypothetical protein MPSEU_000107600 [Mayamaea pseudoterrestris]
MRPKATTRRTMSRIKGHYFFWPCLLLLLLLSRDCAHAQQHRGIAHFGTKLKETLTPPSQRKKAKQQQQQDEFVIQNDRIQAQESIDLEFSNIQLQLDQGRRKGSKTILDGSIHGRAQPGRMLAIMGPSGAGKSTLLHALSGRIKYSSKLQLQGSRIVNQQAVTGDSMLPCAFIEQEVEFFPHMTVRETLVFRVELKLGSQLSKQGRADMVDDLLHQLGLTKVADTIVGNARVRGISGGERKRLSIAVEMISSPSLIMLDEPTSGLDSTAATALIETLRELADQGKTIIAVIHQPSQHVFGKFDDLLLVSEGGKQVYFGERSKVRSYMETHGCRAESDEIGTAEHVLDCITRMPVLQETMEEAEERVDRLAELAKQQSAGTSVSKRDANNQVRRFTGAQGGLKASIFVQFKLLAQRSLREVKRSKGVILIKIVQQVTTALIYGGIYSLGNDQASIQDRFGLLSLITIGASNMAIAGSIRAFPREKAIVSKELANKMYRTFPYFIGKALSELPLVALFNGIFGTIAYHLTGLSRAPGRFRNFLLLLTTHGLISEAAGLVIGAFSPNSDVALAIFPAVLVLNIIFDGKNISEENTPKLLKWVPKLGLIRWGFEGLCVNEFEGLSFVTTGPRRGPVAKTGIEALGRFGLGKYSINQVMKNQLQVTGMGWTLALLGLMLTKQKYVTMAQPNDDEPDTTR